MRQTYLRKSLTVRREPVVESDIHSSFCSTKSVPLTAFKVYFSKGHRLLLRSKVNLTLSRSCQSSIRTRFYDIVSVDQRNVDKDGNNTYFWCSNKLTQASPAKCFQLAISRINTVDFKRRRTVKTSLYTLTWTTILFIRCPEG